MDADVDSSAVVAVDVVSDVGDAAGCGYGDEDVDVDGGCWDVDVECEYGYVY